MIKVEHLYKSFDDKDVLKDITANLYNGKINQIIGQSGSGKTVLMKCLIGLFEVTKGKILYQDKNLTTMSKKEKKELRKEVGMLFQGSALFDSMTVLENVMYPLEMFSGKSAEEMEERARFCLNRVEINPNALQNFPSEISGGMQKRVAIARAIALEPKYLFCDEPNSGLDPVTAIVIDKLIEEITQEYNITTIINTHDMNSIMEIGANIIFIEKGRLAWQGSKDELFHVDNQSLENFVFASELFKKVRSAIA